MEQLSELPSMERRTQSDDEDQATNDDADLKVNLSVILKQSQDIFDSEGSGKPFGLDGFYLQESPSFSDFNNLFKTRPSQPRRQPPAIEKIKQMTPINSIKEVLGIQEIKNIEEITPDLAEKFIKEENLENIIDQFSLRSEENKVIDEEIEILQKQIDVLGIINNIIIFISHFIYFKFP